MPRPQRCKKLFYPVAMVALNLNRLLADRPPGPAMLFQLTEQRVAVARNLANHRGDFTTRPFLARDG